MKRKKDKTKSYTTGGEVSRNSKTSFSRGGESLLSAMTRHGSLDMSIPHKHEGDCGCKKK